MSMLLVFPITGHQSDQLCHFGIVCVTRSLLITCSPYHSDTLPVHSSSRCWGECTNRITPRTSILVDFPVSQPAPFLDMTLTCIIVTSNNLWLLQPLYVSWHSRREQLWHAHLAVTITIPPTPSHFISLEQYLILHYVGNSLPT
jgi:hypothetical protein